MLRSQQAEATIAGREKIIHGAVDIVHQTINTLQENNVCELTLDHKTKLVTNLLTILCSDIHAQPVLNTGS
jgi:hypothetical protein